MEMAFTPPFVNLRNKTKVQNNAEKQLFSKFSVKNFLYDST